MKYNKVQLLILTGFLLVMLPLHGVKKPEKSVPQANPAEFWAIIKDIGSDPIFENEAFDELKNFLNKENPGQRIIFLDGLYLHPESLELLSPLDYAILKKNVSLANYLIQQGANINNLSIGQLQWLLTHQETFADKAWLVSMFSNKDFANNLAINIIIENNYSKEDKILFIDTILNKYAAQFELWCIQGLTYLRILLANPNYINITNINAHFRTPDQGDLLYGAISNGKIFFAYWLANHGAHVNDLEFYAAQPIIALISYMCDANLEGEEFNRCVKLLELLTQKGAYVDLPDKNNLTAIKLLEINMNKYASNSEMISRLQRIWGVFYSLRQKVFEIMKK